MSAMGRGCCVCTVEQLGLVHSWSEVQPELKERSKLSGCLGSELLPRTVSSVHRFNNRKIRLWLLLGGVAKYVQLSVYYLRHFL